MPSNSTATLVTEAGQSFTLMWKAVFVVSEPAPVKKLLAHLPKSITWLALLLSISQEVSVIEPENSIWPPVLCVPVLAPGLTDNAERAGCDGDANTTPDTRAPTIIAIIRNCVFIIYLISNIYL
ncbi:hypothetical protein UA70_14835 [Raoultella planticola]|nr:hypothetical protein UA70_14835 [Raoultella planticola]